MTNDKGAEHEAYLDFSRKAFMGTREEWLEKAFKAGYAAGRQSALDEVVEVLEFYADKTNWEPLLIWNATKCQLESTGKTLDQSVEPDQGKRARELLQKLKDSL